MKKIIFVAIITAISAFGFTSRIDSGQNSSDEFKFQKGAFFKQLNLSDEQKQQIADLRYERQKEAIDLRAEIQKNRLEIKKMIVDNKLDEQKIKSLTKINSDLQGKIKESAVDMWLKVNKMLTPEQQKIWVKNFENMDNFGKAKFMRSHRNGIDGFGNGHLPMMNGKPSDHRKGNNSDMHQ